MASIYFYYNELLRQSADQAVASGRNVHCVGQGNCSGGDEDFQHQDAATKKYSKKQGSNSNPAKANENQDEDGVLKAPFTMHSDTDATLAMLQPRMNRLAYLQTAGATNLDALARSLGPKL